MRLEQGVPPWRRCGPLPHVGSEALALGSQLEGVWVVGGVCLPSTCVFRLFMPAVPHAVVRTLISP